jgi:hypothetical protein
MPANEPRRGAAPLGRGGGPSQHVAAVRHGGQDVIPARAETSGRPPRRLVRIRAFAGMPRLRRQVRSATAVPVDFSTPRRKDAKSAKRSIAAELAERAALSDRQCTSSASRSLCVFAFENELAPRSRVRSAFTDPTSSRREPGPRGDPPRRLVRIRAFAGMPACAVRSDPRPLCRSIFQRQDAKTQRARSGPSPPS